MGRAQGTGDDEDPTRELSALELLFEGPADPTVPLPAPEPEEPAPPGAEVPGA